MTTEPNTSPTGAPETAPTTARIPSTRATGPRTPEGKAVSSRNACKHGLSITRHVILPHEDPQAYETLRAEIHEIYEPQNARERLAVEDLAECRWAFCRFDKAEGFALLAPTKTHSPNQPEVPAEHRLEYLAAFSDQPGRPHSAFISLHNLLRYRSHWERRHQHALLEFDRARRTRLAENRDRRAEAQEHRRQAQERRRQILERRREVQERYREAREQRLDAAERRREQLHQYRIFREKSTLLSLLAPSTGAPSELLEFVSSGSTQTAQTPPAVAA